MLQIKNTLGGGKPEGLYAWKKSSVSTKKIVESSGFLYNSSENPCPLLNNRGKIVTYNGSLYAFINVGNSSSTGAVYKYNSSTYKWDSTTDIAGVPSGMGCVAIMNGELYCFPYAVSTNYRYYDGHCKKYNPSSKTWENVGVFPEKDSSSVVYNVYAYKGKFICSLYSSLSSPDSANYGYFEYDLSNQTLTKIANGHNNSMVTSSYMVELDGLLYLYNTRYYTSSAIYYSVYDGNTVTEVAQQFGAMSSEAFQYLTSEISYNSTILTVGSSGSKIYSIDLANKTQTIVSTGVSKDQQYGAVYVDPNDGQFYFASYNVSYGSFVMRLTKDIPTYTFLDYIVSDKETAYPDGGEKGGYWYEKVVEGLDVNLADFDCTMYETGEIIPTSNSVNLTVNHSLGVKPTYIILYNGTKTGSYVNDFVAVAASGSNTGSKGAYNVSNNANARVDGFTGSASFYPKKVRLSTPDGMYQYFRSGATYKYLIIA